MYLPSWVGSPACIVAICQSLGSCGALSDECHPLLQVKRVQLVHEVDLCRDPIVFRCHEVAQSAVEQLVAATGKRVDIAQNHTQKGIWHLELMH